MKITPAARDSPAEAAVWTMLFSRMFDRLNIRSTAIDITAAGIDAETVIPTSSPRYALAPARTAERTTPRTMALTVISGSDRRRAGGGPEVSSCISKSLVSGMGHHSRGR